MSRELPKPKVLDWLALAITLGLAIASFALMSTDRDKAITNGTFFGFCAAVCAFSIARKLRVRRLRVTKVQIAGGVRIRPSRTLAFGLSGSLLGLGVIMLTFGGGFGAVYSALSGFILLVGAVLFIGVAAGKFPPGYLRFDPVGISVGQRGFAFTVRWDDITSVALAEINDNPVVMLTLHDLDAVIADPPRSKPRVLAKLDSNVRWHGAPVILMTTFFAIDAPVLALAIERYVREHDARAELERRVLRAPTTAPRRKPV